MYENIDDNGHLLVEALYGTEPSSIRELTSLLNAAYDEWFLTDGEGITLEVNSAAERMYEISREEIIGKSIFELEKMRIFYPSVTAMVLRHKRSQTILQTTRNGRTLISTGTPLFDADGNIYRVISNSMDITEFYLFKSKPEEHKIHTVEEELKTNSPAMTKTLDAAMKVAAYDATVLLQGETGVGKNRLARQIHMWSARHHGPFIEINCAAIPDSLLESELFGYESGAFTGARRQGKKGKVELANGGTLFLNEIAELPLSLQGKLLDVLQDRVISRVGSTETLNVNFRVITATNRNLQKMVQEGLFREDLFYRLHVFPIFIPPLRQRIEDVADLANDFLCHFKSRYHTEPVTLTSSAIQWLKEYSWPGNIREMENLLERITILKPGQLINDMDLMELTPNPDMVKPTDLKSRMMELEKQIFLEAAKTHSTTYEIANALQISQATVVRKLTQFQIKLR